MSEALRSCAGGGTVTNWERLQATSGNPVSSPPSRPEEPVRPPRSAFAVGMVSLSVASGPAAPALLTAQGPADSLLRALPNDNRIPAGRLLGDTLLVCLVAQRVRWHLDGDEDPGLPVLAFAEEGSPPKVPGPLLRVPAGTTVHAGVRNSLADTLVVHGLGSRGGPATDSLVVPPGATRETRFRAERAGTYFYWATAGPPRRKLDRRYGKDSQLTGAFVVDPVGNRAADDRILVITGHVDVLDGDGQLLRDARNHPEREFVALNGRSWPHTERLTHALGDMIRWRIVNASYAPHAMHLHGFYFAVEARGDNVADTVYAPAGRRRAVTEPLRVGHTLSIAWSPDRPGGWLFHCHMTSHFTSHAPVDRSARLDHTSRHDADEPDSHALTGMGGLVLATTVRGRSPGPTREPAHAHRLRLFVNSDSLPGDTVRRFGYVLQTGATVPSLDSVPAPGPTIVLTRGRPSLIEVVNRTEEPTAVHWHGIELESYYDGVVGVGGMPERVTPAIRPGKQFAVRITPRRAGTFIYHTHYTELRQLFGGLYGALIVLEPGERWDSNRDRVLIISDAREGPRAMLNGSTDPPGMTLRLGVPYRFRWINITANRARPRASLRRAGQPVTWRVLAKDGWPVSPEQAGPVPSETGVSVGETLDVAVTPETAGELTFEVRNQVGEVLVAIPVRVW